MRCLYCPVYEFNREMFFTAPQFFWSGATIARLIAGDGQVTLGDTVIKQSARKIRRVYNEKVLVGFAGATADAFALFSRLEAKLEQFQGNLNRAAVELGPGMADRSGPASSGSFPAGHGRQIHLPAFRNRRCHRTG